MGAFTGDVLFAQASDALDKDQDVHILISGFPQWLRVIALSRFTKDVGTLQGEIEDGSKIAFRKDALTAVRATEKRSGSVHIV